MAFCKTLRLTPSRRLQVLSVHDHVRLPTQFLTSTRLRRVWLTLWGPDGHVEISFSLRIEAYRHATPTRLPTTSRPRLEKPGTSDREFSKESRGQPIHSSRQRPSALVRF